MILGGVLAAGLTWLAVLIIRNHHEQQLAKAVIAALADAELEEIYGLIERIGTAPSKGYVGLVRGSPKSARRLTVVLPDGIEDFPWYGRIVQVVTASGGRPPVEFRMHESADPEETSDDAVYRWLAIPVITVGQKKRMQNVFSLNRYMGLSAALRDRLTQLHAANPELLLALLLSADGRCASFEPDTQMRCGLTPAWIQSPRFHKCPTCRRPMRMILQVPGLLLGARLAEGCFYLFGCSSHVDQTVTDEDWG